MPPSRDTGQKNVFLNVPFDASYERLFVALIVSIVALGRTPRCVLEIRETGQGRLTRLHKLLCSCASSVHDLSRVGLPVRFNMPFELGIAFTLSRGTPRHKFIIMESKRHRLQRNLSDVNGLDPLIHGGNASGVMGCILSHLGKAKGNPSVHQVERVYKELWKAVPELKKGHKRNSIYSRGLFGELVAGATLLSVKNGLIKS